MKVAGAAALLALTFVSISYVAVGSYNPFIYLNLIRDGAEGLWE